MYPHTAAFDAAIVEGHVVTASADLLQDGELVATGLDITGGSVTVDVTAAVRRHCVITLVDPDGTFVPTDVPSKLAPYGNELKLYRGIQGLDQIPLGVFRIANATLTDAGTQTWTVTGYDRSRIIARSRFTDAYTVAAATNYATAIQTLVDGIMGGLTFHFISTTYTTPQLVFDAEADPWQAAMNMADSIGCELFFDPDGACVLRRVPDPLSSSIAWTYAEGDSAIVLSVERAFDDDPGYNGVVVFGETTGNSTPVRAESWDYNPASPTYYLGPYGKVPRFERSSFVTTSTQAQEAADAMARRLLGVTEQVRFTSIVHPAHDAGDVVALSRAGVGLNDVFALESFDVPLQYGAPLTATTRRRKAAA